MSSRLSSVSFQTADPAATAAFWGAILGRQVVEDAAGVLVPGDATQVGLRFVAATEEKTGPNRLHVHMTSSTVEGQRQTVAEVLDAGGRRRGDGPLPFGRDIYMADPGGNEFCVIEPGNAYLEGCGFLGEVTCEGTPAVGRFWAAALNWPIVWDRDEQIVIQSPSGGTKIAWDGPVEPSAPGWHRQRFDLVTADVESETRRLLALGATPLPARSGLVTLADPDGGEFTLSKG